MDEADDWTQVFRHHEREVVHSHTGYQEYSLLYVFRSRTVSVSPTCMVRQYYNNNIIFRAIGFFHWPDTDSSSPRRSRRLLASAEGQYKCLSHEQNISLLSLSCRRIDVSYDYHLPSLILI